MNPLENFESYHIRKILQELKTIGIDIMGENIPRIIEETSFDRRSQNHPDECPYYKTGKPCVSDVLDFNCFLCACPEFDSKKDEGGCRINHPLGKWHYPYLHSASGRVWDCSDCSIPHFPVYVEQYLIQNLEKLKKMQDEV
ncbi:MAG: cysteine-rich small domain-containing protein [Candidatus Nanoarchaeia archaeon]|nr:cysteine-rich small domain-containing protein [Candidatus Nanoarchaeia archaeon]